GEATGGLAADYGDSAEALGAEGEAVGGAGEGDRKWRVFQLGGNGLRKSEHLGIGAAGEGGGGGLGGGGRGGGGGPAVEVEEEAAVARGAVGRRPCGGAEQAGFLAAGEEYDQVDAGDRVGLPAVGQVQDGSDAGGVINCAGDEFARRPVDQHHQADEVG